MSKPINTSYENTLLEHSKQNTTQLQNIEGLLLEILFCLKDSQYNFIKTYELKENRRQNLNFHYDTSNIPIRKVEILGTGGGLVLWINGNIGLPCHSGVVINDVEINKIEYQVKDGTANITLYTRIQ